MVFRTISPRRSASSRLSQVSSKWKFLLIFFSVIYVTHLVVQRKNILTHHAHTITPYTVSFTNSVDEGKALSSESANNFCASLNFPAYLASTPRRIYDVFLFNTELDWLEIRLETLFNSVDYFVIVESTTTFTGQIKPLHLKNDWSRFEKFHSKIIHHVLTNPPKNPDSAWDVETHQRNALFSQVFPFLDDSQAARKGDIIVVSDVDEIPRPASMFTLRNCDVPKYVTLRSQFYYYSFQWLHRGPQWPHGQATIFGGLEPGQTILPHDLRGNRAYRWWNKVDIWNAGWHCSTCFETVGEVLTKMRSFSHVAYNAEEFREQSRMLDRIRNGKDLWDRRGENYDRVDNNEDTPEYIKANRTRFEYLLNRDGKNAGFTDVPSS